MRARTNIARKERRRFVLSDLRGVDFSSSPLQVSPNRATDMCNFIAENGMNQKRHGWRQRLHLKDADGNPLPIGGIFPYENGEKTELLVYAGKRFFRVQNIGEDEDPVYTDVSEGEPDSKLRPNPASWHEGRCQGFYSKGAIYLVGCGEYLRYQFYEEYANSRWCLESVRSAAASARISSAYIPTTTVSIDPIDAEDPKRVSLDAVNLLTRRRKNKLVGQAFAEGDEETVWQLDSDWLDLTEGVYLEIEKEGDVLICMKSNSENELYDLEHDLRGKVDQWGRITLNFDTAPPIDGMSNITVWFSVKEGWGDRRPDINQCRFGVLFGVGGNADRLFLAGNPDFPNVEFFSEADDFTYFPDTYTATFGTDQNEITGFLRMSDQTLAIFKRYSTVESSVYYQSGVYREYYESDGDLEKILPVFSITAGATGESAINAYTGASFAGDNLILSENGVYAIALTENVATNARTARERSRAINARLSRHAGLSEAVGIAWRGKYYLAVDGVCYVADSRYKYQPSDSTDYNYEWWFWENIPARTWAVVESALWFGTGDGMLCMFDEAYSDRSFYKSEAGELGFDFAAGRMNFGTLGFEPRENDCVRIKTDGVFARYPIRISSWTEDGVLYADGDVENIQNLFEGTEIYLDGVGTSGLKEGAPYYVIETDRADCSFRLMDAEGALASLSGVDPGFRLLISVSERDMYVCDVQEHSFGLKQMCEDTVPLELVNYFVPTDDNGGEDSIVPLDPIAEFWRCENVVAKWYTPLFDFGTNESSKTLEKLTISCLPQKRGRLTFGYETRKSDCELRAKGTGAFSFDDLDFSNFSFETGFANSYSVKVKERNFNFIMFRFVSDSDSNCCIHDFTVTYKINKRNMEVK